jgi:hypothetical protein
MDTLSHNFSQASHSLLGDYSLSISTPLNVKKILEWCKKSDSKNKNLHQRLDGFFHFLTQEIASITHSVFLLPTLSQLFEELKNDPFFGAIHFSHYELWLNQYSGLSKEANYKIRAMMCGKYIPRDFYQSYFPIGQNKTYFGSHYVTAHSSPDLDTTVASFWGWIDALGSRVSEGLHIWNVPGGAPSYQVEFKLIFDDIFSPHLFQFCARHRGALQVSSLELLTQVDTVKKSVEGSSLSIDLEKNSQAVVLVDEDGFYQGDWRTVDIEGVRQVVMLVNQMLRHFENRFQQELIALFSKEDLKKSDLKPFIAQMLGMKLKEAESFKELSQRQLKHVSDYLVQVLNVKEGLEADIRSMAKGFSEISITRFEKFVELVQGQLIEKLFNSAGELTATRTALFKTLDQIIQALDEAIHTCRRFVDRLNVSLDIKSKVFGYRPLYVTDKSDVEELRAKMGNSAYLTVTMHDGNKLVPMGVIYASDLYKPILGTVTLRDFSNRDETKVPSYLEVISVIDHHKLQLSGTTPATIYISDVQSSNVIVAELAFSINDRLSSSGMSQEKILKQLESLKAQKASKSERRIQMRLLQKLHALEQKGSFYIDPTREYVEYLHFLFAILDDTDFLSKVSYKDVMTVKSLINRMKTILRQEEVEVVNFDDLTQDATFVQNAAMKLLKNEDLYSITKKIYHHKEKFIESIIEKGAEGVDNLFFADTKEQNGCVRIGQFKFYPINYPCFKKYAVKLQKAFISESIKSSISKKEIDLHLFMISTLAGIDATKDQPTSHLDEIWLYVPKDSEGGMTHLRSFLNAFGASSGAKKAIKKIQLHGKKDLYEDLLMSTLGSSLKVPIDYLKSDVGGDLIVLEVISGSMNSRKAMITPFLPKLVG